MYKVDSHLSHSKTNQGNSTSQINKKNRSHFYHFFAGLIGSITSTLVCAPLDLMKVRIQVQNPKKKIYHGTIDTMKKIYSDEGIGGFYKGVKTAVVSVPLFYSLYFPLYEYSKTFYSVKFYGNTDIMNIKVYSFAALTSAVICDVITNPLWVVRVRNQTAHMHSKEKLHTESFNIFRDIISIYKKEGLYALYRGLFISFIGIPHVIIQFSLYESLKNMFSTKMNKSIDKVPYYFISISSMISKLTASFVTYPHEVIRNSLQNIRNYEEKKMTIMKVVERIKRENGIKGFYAGFGLNLFRILPNNAILFVTYEFISRLFI